jgi:hypothetical protein
VRLGLPGGRRSLARWKSEQIAEWFRKFQFKQFGAKPGGGHAGSVGAVVEFPELFQRQLA